MEYYNANTLNLDETSDEEMDQTSNLEEEMDQTSNLEEEMDQTNHLEKIGKKRYRSDLARDGERLRDRIEKIHYQAKSMESIDGLAVAAIEEAKELVEESVEAFKNGNVKKMMAFAFYALPHKMKEEDKKRLAELIDAKLGWDVPFRMRFTNKMSRTGYVIFEEKFLTRIKKTFQLSFRFGGREVVGKLCPMEKIQDWIQMESDSSSSKINFTYISTTIIGQKNSLV